MTVASGGLTAGADPGMMFVHSLGMGIIETVDSDTQFTMRDPWTGGILGASVLLTPLVDGTRSSGISRPARTSRSVIRPRLRWQASD